MRTAFGLDPINFMYEGKYFKTIYVLSGAWQGTGYGSIIYLSALAGVDQEQHEAAVIDGATRLQRIWHINLPGILPTICIMLIMQCGSLMSVGFEKDVYKRQEIRLGGFFDREIGHVYLYEDPHPAFRPGEEVSRMIWLLSLIHI